MPLRSQTIGLEQPQRRFDPVIPLMLLYNVQSIGPIES
jgi:hypothetical protein